MKVFLLILTVSLSSQLSFAQNSDQMCAIRLFKRLLGTAQLTAELAPDLMQRAMNACRNRNYQQMFQIAHEITGSDRFLQQSIKPFTYMVSDRYNDPNGDTISQGVSLMYYFSSTNKSLRENLFSFNKIPVGNRSIHIDFMQPYQPGSTGAATTAIRLSLSTANHDLVHQLYDQGQCNIQLYNDPIGSQPTACYELANVPANFPFSELANTNPTHYQPPNKVAGLMTLPHDKFSREAFNMGTNRRLISHILKTFLCTDITKIRNSSFTDIYVRKDVSRAPAGSISTYQNVCKGCHAGLDPLANAAVAYNWRDIDANKQGLITRYNDRQGGFVNPPGSFVVSKVNQNNANPGLNLPNVTDDTWHNLWYDDPKLNFGWKAAVLNGNPVDIRTGQGLRSLGLVFTHSEAFAKCIPKRVFEITCGRTLAPEEEEQFISDVRSITDDDDTLRNYFAAVAAHPACTGGL